MSRAVIERPTELIRTLDEIASRSGRSRAELLLAAVRDFVAVNAGAAEDQGLPCSIGSFADDEVTGENSEEWLRAHRRPEDDWGRP
jgi:metal-responsive CopG/Arc/MetJ family transcriptional regulator